jgi:hypothetical protein
LGPQEERADLDAFVSSLAPLDLQVRERASPPHRISSEPGGPYDRAVSTAS